jgi:hypothetical protein
MEVFDSIRWDILSYMYFPTLYKSQYTKTNRPDALQSGHQTMHLLTCLLTALPSRAHGLPWPLAPVRSGNQDRMKAIKSFPLTPLPIMAYWQ